MVDKVQFKHLKSGGFLKRAEDWREWVLGCKFIKQCLCFGSCSEMKWNQNVKTSTLQFRTMAFLN